jgi:hypothetical protein
MNTAAATREALWAGVHTAVDSSPPSDLGQQLKDVSGLGMHVDNAHVNIAKNADYVLRFCAGMRVST